VEQYTLLVNGGIALMGLAGIGAIVAAVVLTIFRKRLNVQLEKEYGLCRRRK